MIREAQPKTVEYVPSPALVASIRRLTPQEQIFFVRPEAPVGHQPGQFVQVSLPGIGEAPISIASSPTRNGGFDLCIRRAGNVTGALHRLKPGATLGIRGPFGRGIPLDECAGRDIVIIAGGLGLAPMRSMIQYICDDRDKFKKVTVLIGSRSPQTLLFADEYDVWREKGRMAVEVTVDTAREGWTGHVGVITKLIPQIEMWPESTAAIVCGPPVMYHFVLRKLLERRLAADHIFLSLERRMKCGMGKCGHCQMNDIYVCLDGPVFRYDRIAAIPEAVS